METTYDKAADRFEDTLSKKWSVRKRISYTLLLFIAPFLLALIALGIDEIQKLHSILTSSHWPVGAHIADPLLGFKPNPGFSGRMLDGGFSIHHHQLGYRIPHSSSATEIKPGGILAIGCSFTYGDTVEAEQTFSYQLGKKLQLPVYNYGVCSYSYATMLLLLKKLEEEGTLAKLQPRYLVLGMGRWLELRSMHPFYPAPPPRFTYPYFKLEGKTLTVAPAFPGLEAKKIFDLDIHYFENGKRETDWTLPRLWLLTQFVPIAWHARLSKIEFDQRWNHPDFLPPKILLYQKLVDDVEQFTLHHSLKTILLWMPGNENELPSPELPQALAEKKSLHLIDGNRAIQQFKILPAEYAGGRHPSSLAHETYATYIAKQLYLLYTSGHDAAHHSLSQ